MKGSYNVTDEAESDLDRIWRVGLDRWGEEQADKYYDAFFDRFEQITEQPYLYPAVEHIRKEYRKSICGVDTIYYRVVGNTVEIMRILGRQDRDEWL